MDAQPSFRLTCVLTLALASPACAQQTPAQQPPVKVNVLNVCTPSVDDQKELSASLAKAPGKPAFSKDYEVSRGHSTLDASTPIPGLPAMPPGTTSSADWVRVRREFPDGTFFSNIQYSFSVDEKNMVETLVLHVRDPKDLMEISIEDSASTVASATAMLSSNTPVSRVKLERFGKSSVVLARCSGEEGTPTTDQTAYEPILHAASSIMERYREALVARKLVPQELARLGVGTKPAPSTSIKAGGKDKANDKKQP
ncbi:MAG TPA: hypothetical protein VKR59_18980 [Terriglobales bacterium]|nr:hypothetical protein [Terriglobales bacterium]